MQNIDDFELVAVGLFVVKCRNLEHSENYKAPDNPLFDIIRKYFPSVHPETIRKLCLACNACVRKIDPDKMVKSYRQLAKEAREACRANAEKKPEEMMFRQDIGHFEGNPFGRSQPVDAQPAVVTQVVHLTSSADPRNNWLIPRQEENPTPTKVTKELAPVPTFKKESPRYILGVVSEEASMLATSGKAPRVSEQQSSDKPDARTTTEPFKALLSPLQPNKSSQAKHQPMSSAEIQPSQAALTTIVAGNKPQQLRQEPAVLPVTNSSHQVQNPLGLFTPANTQQPSSNLLKTLPVPELNLQPFRKPTNSIGKPSVPPNNKPST